MPYWKLLAKELWGHLKAALFLSSARLSRTTRSLVRWHSAQTPARQPLLAISVRPRVAPRFRLLATPHRSIPSFEPLPSSHSQYRSRDEQLPRRRVDLLTPF